MCNRWLVNYKDWHGNSALHLSYLPAFMISSKDCNSIPVTNLQSHQESDSLNWVVSTICEYQKTIDN